MAELQATVVEAICNDIKVCIESLIQAYVLEASVSYVSLPVCEIR